MASWPVADDGVSKIGPACLPFWMASATWKFIRKVEKEACGDWK